MRFTRHRGHLRADLDSFEAEVLAQLAHELLGLVEPADLEHEDPLAALVGLPSGDVPLPDDPVLLRLLPDAYRNDPSAAGDFRRYTDADLRASKRANAEAVVASVPEGGGRMELDRDQADAWLGALNDMRLAIGTSLDVSEQTDLDDYDEQHPAYQALQVYGWLGWLQESLLSCIEPRLG
jgi:FAD/FMN-containing dehydrogenase